MQGDGGCRRRGPIIWSASAEGFSNRTELERHVGQGGCWATMMVINRLYDMSVGEVAPKQKDKAVLEREKMIRIKQEKVERAQQIQVSNVNVNVQCLLFAQLT